MKKMFRRVCSVFSWVVCLMALVTLPQPGSAYAEDSWLPIEKNEYLNLLSDSNVLLDRGYLVYCERIKNGKETILEVFGDGTIILVECLCNKFTYDKLAESGFDWTNLDPDTRGYQDLAGREIGLYLNCYVIEDKDVRDRLFLGFGDTELFTTEWQHVHGDEAKMQYIAVYIDNHLRHLRWYMVDLFTPDPYPGIVSLIQEARQNIIANGDLMPVDKLLEIKKQHNEAYFGDPTADPDIIEHWAYLFRAIGQIP